MKASDFEFRNRFWIITALFVASFSFYALGDQNLVLVTLGLLKRWPGIPPGAVARAMFGLGATSALLCALLRTWAAAYLNSRVVQSQQLHSSRLVADGPYRHVRNPLYLGSILLALGFVPMTTPFGAVLLVVGITTFVHRLIGKEEPELLSSQGARFRRYCDAVPRLLPSLAPRLPPSGDKPGWLQGILGETMMWGFFLALAGFALTFSPRVYGFAMALALLSNVAVKAVLWRKPKGPATAGDWDAPS